MTARGRCVLVVEDDVLVRRALHRALAGFGHQVLEASSVDEAIAVLSTTPVDAVTLDVGLGERRGIDVARYIAGEVYPKPVMVVLTGEARPRGGHAPGQCFSTGCFARRSIASRGRRLPGKTVSAAT